MTAAQTRNKNMTAAFVTIGASAAVLLVLWYMIIFEPQGMGLGNEPGIEVNLGDSETGSGDFQPTEPVGSEKPQNDEPEAAQSPNQEEVANTQPEETTPPAPTEVAKATESVVTSKEESPVEVKEKEEKKEVKPIEKKEVIEKKKEPEPKVEKKVEAPKVKEPVKEEKKQPVADVNAKYKPGTASKTDGSASGKEGKPGGEGDDKSGEGDKGVPGGTPGAAVYKGKPGGGTGGPVLELNGWDWDNEPKPAISNSETGRIEFEIKVDSQGEMVSYRKLTSGLSAASEKACIEALQRLSFVRKGTGKVQEETTGKIIFIVTAR